MLCWGLSAKHKNVNQLSFILARFKCLQTNLSAPLKNKNKTIINSREFANYANVQLFYM